MEKFRTTHNNTVVSRDDTPKDASNVYGRTYNYEYFNYAGATRMVNKKKWFNENVKDLNRALCYK